MDDAILKRLAQERDALGTAKALADRIGVSTAYLSDVFLGHRTPGPKILAFLGIERVVVYRKLKGKRTA